ncbi:MAG: YjgP/YjgQ family permease [Planctomycetes bacterium]|nr:YjgP/YjgQ family permease [Planctomycetota bacterium]
MHTVPAMIRITRYVVSELMKVFVATLFAMTAFVILAVVGAEAVREGLGVEAVARLLPYSLPMALRFTVPGTILFACCSVFGRMSASNEIVAIKSLGVSPMAVIRPALILAIIVSCLAVWVNDVAVSWGTAGVHRVILQSIEQIVYGRLRTQRSYSNQRGLAIQVKDVDGDRLIRPTLSYQPNDGSRPVSITADEAQMKLNADNSALVVVFDNMRIDGDKLRGDMPGRFEYEIPLSIAARKGRDMASPSDIPMSDLRRTVEETRRDIDDRTTRLAVDAAYQMASGNFDRLRAPHWRPEYQAIENQHGRLNRLHMEPWRRWAAGFSCLFFAMVGVPLAILLRNADFWTSFGACFLPILILYYPLFMAGMDRAKAGAVPPFAVWAGNIVLLVVGTFLLRRVLRH